MVGSKRKMVAFLLRAVEDVEYTFCFFEEMRNGVRNVSRIVNVLPNIILICESYLAENTLTGTTYTFTTSPHLTYLIRTRVLHAGFS